MVDFLLDNTLGAWRAGKILAANPRLAESAQSEEELRQAVALPGCPWKYLRFIKIEDGKWTPAAGTFDGWPKSGAELKCLDPCMGSGHFVVAMFERLVALRLAEETLDEAAAVAAVIRDNLFGLEIDPRCTQIGAFNLALAAWRRVGYCTLPALNIACSGLAPNTSKDSWINLGAILAKDSPLLSSRDLLGSQGEPMLLDARLATGMARLYNLFQKAPIFGSLINPRAGDDDLLIASFHELQPLLEKALAQETKDDTAHEMAVTARGLAKAAEILAGQFTLVATNVPYLGRGKQDDVLKAYCDRVYPEAKADLATCFVERCLTFCAAGGSTSLVTPQNWWFLSGYRKFRKLLLESYQFSTIATLGEEAWQSFGDRGPFAALLVINNARANAEHGMFSIDALPEPTIDEKIQSLLENPLTNIKQAAQFGNPDHRITVEQPGAGALLRENAYSFAGICSGDFPRFGRVFWEVPTITKEWEFQQSTMSDTVPYAGCEGIFLWEGGKGVFYDFVCEILGEKGVAAWIRGEEAHGKRGIIVSSMRYLPSALYVGRLFDNNTAVIVPEDPNHLAPMWCFCSSESFRLEVRKIDKKKNVTNATFVKVPFDLAHWQKVAAEKYPDGLPKPFSSDPTQWLFNGHPAGADQPLQVAVAQLLGYQWPRQTGSSFPDCSALSPDGLEKFADYDGIVCLSALNREQPAATQLRALLHAALGSYDERDLIRKSGPKGSTKTSLEEWLRDDFFAQHCALFHSRPFLWHLWDGEKDGFHALVNYHKLDHANLKKLAYTYLGDWIRDQDAAAKAETPGAAERLGAAKKLQAKLIAILEGEAPMDLFIRWKPLHQQPMGWNPDLNDGVRHNIRPFLLAGDVGAKGAGLFRAKPGIDPKPKPDRGTEPQRAKADYPWFWCAEDPGTDPAGGKEFTGRRWNTVHFTLERKQRAREEN
jgi:hypothetical protein